MDCRQEMIFCDKEAIQDCVFKAVKRWGTSRLYLSLDFELVAWNKKKVIGMNTIDLYFCGGIVTVLYVSSWLSAYLFQAWGASCSQTKAVRRMTFLPNTYWWLRSLPMTGTCYMSCWGFPMPPCSVGGPKYPKRQGEQNFGQLKSTWFY